MESNDDDEQVAEAVDDIVTHMIQVHVGTSEDPCCTEERNINEESFSHFAHIDEGDEPLLFTALLHEKEFSHATLAVIFKKKFGDKL